MRLIDADAVEKQAYDDVHYHAELEDFEFDVVTHYLDHAPTIDAVEVVRCKDCKHYHADLGWCDEHSHFVDEERSFCYPHESTEWKMFEPDYFCADGERKDGD